MADESNAVINTSDDKFEADVMIRSQLGLVIVDFWAEWCAPCRALAPALESVVSEFADQVTLVKANTDEAPNASQTFGVSGIPAVFAVLDGKVINSFQGALGEPQIRDWIKQCLQQSRLLEIEQRVESEPEVAETMIRTLLDEIPSDQIRVLLLRVLHAQKKTKETQTLLSELEQRGFLEPECEKIRAELSLQTKSATDLDALRAQAESNPANFELQFRLAEALASQQELESALEICLRLVAEDRQATGEQARKLMLDVFRIEGDESDLTKNYRRKLSLALY